MFSKLLLMISSIFALSYGAGTYDGYAFSDTEEKYALHWLNYYPSTEFTGMGLTTTDATAIIGLRPITSLLTVANNTNIAGTDMFRIRDASHRITIPPQAPFDDYNSTLGITERDQNFLYGLTGLIVGAGFYFGFITLIARAK